MLFKILKLFGLDVPAKVDAAKALIEERAAEVADRAKHMALSAALIVALSTFAGLFLTMAIGVGLAGALSYRGGSVRNERRSWHRRDRPCRCNVDSAHGRIDAGEIVVRQAGARASERCRDTSGRSCYAAGKGPATRSASKVSPRFRRATL